MVLRPDTVPEPDAAATQLNGEGDTRVEGSQEDSEQATAKVSVALLRGRLRLAGATELKSLTPGFRQGRKKLNSEFDLLDTLSDGSCGYSSLAVGTALMRGDTVERTCSRHHASCSDRSTYPWPSGAVSS